MNTTVKLVIAVTPKDAFLVDYPDEISDFIDGNTCEDNGIDNVPEEVGVYECEAEYWFEQGYSDGYPAPGESDWGSE